MKKIFIILLLILLPIFVNAEDRVNVKLEYVPNVYWNYKKNNILYWGQFAYIYAGDKIAYCLDINTPVTRKLYTKTDTVLSSDLIYKFSYFGYGYENNNSLKDYMATQKILWYYTNSVDVYFTTESNGNGTKIDISNNEDRIRYISNNYASFPTYNNLKFIVGSSNNLEKTNSNINQFNVINSSKNDISIDLNNNILFDANEIGESKFYLETKYAYNYENTIYIANDSQKIITVGNIENLKKEYAYEVIGGSISINVKFDKNIDENITNNEFELYNSNNELIGIYSPDEDGNIKINNLYIGTYRLIHTAVSNGYNVDKKEYTLNINESNLDLKLNIILYLKKTKLYINKTYSNAVLNILKYDSDIIYKIYDENNNYINEIVTNEKGYAEIELDYGIYKIVQSNINGTDIYHQDLIIDKTMFDDLIEHKIHDKIYKSNLKIITLNKNTNKIICNVDFKINGMQYTTNENGIYVINNMDYGIYNFDSIELDGYNKIHPFAYELNQNNDYYVQNEELYTDFKIYFEEDIEQEIKNNDEIINEDNDEINKVNNDKMNDVNNNEEKNTNGFENEIIEENEEISISDIYNSNVREENNNLMYEDSLEKLPFLGDNLNNYENSKIIYYIYNFIKFSWL